MKKHFFVLGTVIFLMFVAYAEADSKGATLSGEVAFAVDYKVSVMEQKGFRFIGKGTYGRYLTNYFGAQNAAIIVKNAKGEIIGVGKANSDGRFALTLEPSTFYQISVEYRGRKIEKVISSSDATKNIQLDLGRFETRLLRKSSAAQQHPRPERQTPTSA